MNTLERLVGVARKYFDRVSVGAQDATRTRQDFLHGFARLAFEAGADRLRIADTVGMISPLMVIKTMTDLCHLVAKASGREIPESKPIVGKNVFCHESGIHCSGLLKEKARRQKSLLTPAELKALYLQPIKISSPV